MNYATLERRVADDLPIEACLQNYYADPGLRVSGFRRYDFGAEHSILGELASWCAGGATAMHARSIELARTDATRSMLEIVVKPKYSDSVVLAVATEVATLCSRELGAAFAKYGAATGLMGNMRRELGVYARATGALRAALPTCYGECESEGVRVLLLERVNDVAPIDRVHHAQIWTHAEIETVLMAIGRIHGEWWERASDIRRLLGGDLGTDRLATLAAMPLWTALSAFARPCLSRLIGESGARLQASLAESTPMWLGALEDHARTLIHNDFNARNLVLRARAPGIGLCAFDWELAQYGLPQRDLIELLCFALNAEYSQGDIEHFVEFHRHAVQRAAARSFAADHWTAGIRLALADFGVRRLPMYYMANRLRPQRYLERVTRTWMRLAQVFDLKRLPVCGLASR